MDTSHKLMIGRETNVDFLDPCEWVSVWVCVGECGCVSVGVCG